MSFELYFRIPFIPPSLNSLYHIVNIRGHPQEAKSKEAKAFERRFAKEILPTIIRPDTKIPPIPAVLEVEIGCFLADIRTKGWARGKALSPYNRHDVDNLVKLVTDCLKTNLLTDDHFIFKSTSSKHEPEEGEGSWMGVILREGNLADYLRPPFPEARDG